MAGNRRSHRKSLLSVTGVVEAATGVLLLIAPSMLVNLLLGAAPASAAGMTVSRVAGVALLTLGVACWLGRDVAGRAVKRQIAAMLLYNVAVVVVLVHARITMGLVGIAFWPVVVAHTVLAAWCITCLAMRTTD